MKVSASVRPEHVDRGGVLARRAPPVARAVARRHRLDQLRARPARLRSRRGISRIRPAIRSTSRSAARRSAVVSRAASSLDRLADEALALAIWSALAGAVAIVAAAVVLPHAVAPAAGSDPVRRSPGQTPVTGRLDGLSRSYRGLTPSLGGGAAGRVPAVLDDRAAADERHAGTGGGARRAGAHRRGLEADPTEPAAWLPWGALVAGLAAGVRSQTVWLTLPLLALAMVAQRRAGAWWLLSRPVAALAAGGLAWAVPLARRQRRPRRLPARARHAGGARLRVASTCSG